MYHLYPQNLLQGKLAVIVVIRSRLFGHGYSIHAQSTLQGCRRTGEKTEDGRKKSMSQEKVLIVEDEENERTGLAELVSSWGYRADTARDGGEGLEKAVQWAPSIVITDLKMPRMGGIELLERLAEQAHTVAVVLVTAQGTIDSAVQAMRMGAYDYITKPIDTNRLRTILQNASSLLGTRAELEATRRKLRDAGSLGRLNGASRKMQEIFRLIEMVAPSTASVLITGASGTGKELVARTIHELSSRRDRPPRLGAWEPLDGCVTRYKVGAAESAGTPEPRERPARQATPS